MEFFQSISLSRELQPIASNIVLTSLFGAQVHAQNDGERRVDHIDTKSCIKLNQEEHLASNSRVILHGGTKSQFRLLWLTADVPAPLTVSFVGYSNLTTLTS